jgi:glycosyltransferase involved in cell wall biosynthesis
MSCYNKQSWVAEAIESVLSQTMKDIELVVCDDASNDYSMDVLEHYAKVDKRVKILRNEENMGVSYTNNKAKKATTGEIICVADGDDVFDPNRAKYSYDFLKKNKDCDAVYMPFFKSYWDLSKPPFELKDTETFDGEKLKKAGGQFIGHGFMAYTRKVCDSVFYPDARKYGSDHDFILAIHNAGYKFGRLELPKKKGEIDMDKVRAGKVKVGGIYRFTDRMTSNIHREYIVNEDKKLEVANAKIARMVHTG